MPWIVCFENIHPSPANAVVATKIQAALRSLLNLFNAYDCYYRYQLIVSDLMAAGYEIIIAKSAA